MRNLKNAITGVDDIGQIPEPYASLPIENTSVHIFSKGILVCVNDNSLPPIFGTCAEGWNAPWQPNTQTYREWPSPSEDLKLEKAAVALSENFVESGDKFIKSLNACRFGFVEQTTISVIRSAIELAKKINRHSEENQ